MIPFFLIVINLHAYNLYPSPDFTARVHLSRFITHDSYFFVYVGLQFVLHKILQLNYAYVQLFSLKISIFYFNEGNNRLK